jgi:hypothetical protein
VEERALEEDVVVSEISERGKGGELVADAKQKLAAAQVPEVLTVVVEQPFGAGEDAARGEFEEQSVDVAVQLVGPVFRGTPDEAAGDEREQDVAIVDVVQGYHRASTQQVTGQQGLKAERIEGDPGSGWGSVSSRERDGRQQG